MASLGKTILVASKDLVIDGKPIKAGTTLATVEHAIPLDRVLAGTQNGAAIEKSVYDAAVKDKSKAEVDEAQRKLADLQRNQADPPK